MATYGLKTYKEDGTTVVLANSNKTAVYGKTLYLDNAGTGATRSMPNYIYPYLPEGTMYFIDFPEYVGRTLRPMQLGPGPHEWIVGVESGIPYVRWSRQLFRISDYGITNPDFNYTVTVLYVFVK
jgi:hypothetical protein